MAQPIVASEAVVSMGVKEVPYVPGEAVLSHGGGKSETLMRVGTAVVRSESRFPSGYVAAAVLYGTGLICILYCADASYL